MSETIPTESEWKTLDLLDNLIQTYQKPKYDPYEIFNPSKSFLKGISKELRAECYQLIAEGSQDPIAAYCNEPRLRALNQRIREYVYRLQGVRKGSGREIGPDQIRRAKESPIQDYFAGGKLRRAGKTLVGTCPLQTHTDKTGSFTIYTDQNTFHCFGCGAGRDTIDLVMKTQNLTFRESIKLILKI